MLSKDVSYCQMPTGLQFIVKISEVIIISVEETGELELGGLVGKKNEEVQVTVEVGEINPLR